MVTLITFDGFVKQLNYEPFDKHHIRIPTMRYAYRRVNEVFDPLTSTSFEVRDFYRVGNTNVYEEK